MTIGQKIDNTRIKAAIGCHHQFEEDDVIILGVTDGSFKIRARCSDCRVLLETEITAEDLEPLGFRK